MSADVPLRHSSRAVIMTAFRRIVLAFVGQIIWLVQSGPGSRFDFHLKAPAWFHVVSCGCVFTFLGVMFTLVTVIAGQVTWLSVAFGLGATALGLALIRLASVLRPRS